MENVGTKRCLKKIYQQKRAVSSGIGKINLTFADRGLVFLLGKSGSGKSTFLNLCGGLDMPDSGEIIINGKSTKDFSVKEFDSYRNTCIGFVFQEYNLLDEFTVKENVGLALNLQGKRNDDALIESTLDKVELKDFANSKINTLSGGQKQRVAIARAIIKEPKYILADEPTGALDSQTGEQIFELLKKLSCDTLVIVVSHDRELAIKYADRIIELKDGKVISDEYLHENFEENSRAVSQSTNDVKTNFIKPSLPIKYAGKLGANCIKKKPVRFVFTVVLTVLSLIMFGIFSCLMFFDKDAIVCQSLENSNEQVFELTKYYEITRNTYEKNKVDVSSYDNFTYFSQTDINHLIEEYDVVPVYEYLYNTTLTNLSLESEFYSSVIRGLIAANNLEYILGKAPANANEVAISDFTWESIKNGKLVDAQGNAISVDDSLDNVVISWDNINYYKVCGVYKAQEVPQKYRDLLVKVDKDTSDMWDLELLTKINFYNYIAIYEPAYYDMVKDRESITANSASGAVFSLSYDAKGILSDSILRIPSDKLNYYNLDGNKTSYIHSDNSIILPFDDYANLMNEYIEVVKKQNMSDEFNDQLESQNIQSLLNGVITQEYSINESYQILKTVTEFIREYTSFNFMLDFSVGDYTQKVKLLGYTLDDKICLSSDLLEDYKTNTLAQNKKYMVYESEYNPDDYDANIYRDVLILTDGFSKQDYAQLLYNTECIDSGTYYLVSNDLYSYFNTVARTLSLAVNVFLGLGIAFMVFAMLLLFNFISVSIVNKKRQLGILRALGSGKKDIFKIFLVEPIIIIVVSCIIAIILTGVLTVVLNNSLFNDEGINISVFVFDWKSVLAIIAVAVVACFAATFVPICKATKITPFECIRSA